LEKWPIIQYSRVLRLLARSFFYYLRRRVTCYLPSSSDSSHSSAFLEFDISSLLIFGNIRVKHKGEGF